MHDLHWTTGMAAWIACVLFIAHPSLAQAPDASPSMGIVSTLSLDDARSEPRSTLPDTRQPTSGVGTFSETEEVALTAIMIAVDGGSVSDLAAGLDLLGCATGCGPLLDGLAILHRAARDSTPEVVDLLLRSGVSIDLRRPPLGWTPLLTALNAARPDIARVLMERGADASLTGLDGASAPFMADLIGLSDLIPFPPVELTKEEADRILLLAVEANDLGALRLALDAGADPRAVAAANGWSALMIAAFNGYFEIASELLDERHGSPTATLAYAEDTSGMTAIHAVMIGAAPDRRVAQVCTLAVLMNRGIDMSVTTREGLTIQDIGEKAGSFGILAEAASSRNVEASCFDKFGREGVTIDVVDVSEGSTGQPTASFSARQPEFEGSQEDLVKALQAALDLHACRPGIVDGSYGPATARAARLYDLVRPPECGRIEELEPIGRLVAAPEWQALAESSLAAMNQCRPTTVCGGAPGPEFRRELGKGCWYVASNPLPDEYAIWDGRCDAEGRIDGRGTLSFNYPSGAPGNFLKATDASMSAGKPGTGEVRDELVDGRVMIMNFRDGLLDGPYQSSNADQSVVISGNYENDLRDGTWTQGGPGLFESTVEYRSGVPIEGVIQYGDLSTYRGGVNEAHNANGIGELTSSDGTIRELGGWQNGRREGRMLWSFRLSDGSTRSHCRFYNNGQSIEVDLPDGTPCLNR